MRNLAVKGFNSNMKCRDFQYEIGKTYKINERPKLCQLGFHYCKTLNDVYSFYPRNQNNKYCLVEILGDIDDGLDKSSTNHIKIVKEITEFDRAISLEQLEELSKVGFIIGGSLALKFLGFKINREINEIDLIIDEEKFQDKFYDNYFKYYKRMERNGSGCDSVVLYKDIYGNKYDIIKTTSKSFIVRNIKGFNLALSDPNEIWKHKLKYGIMGSIKHLSDIRANNIEFIVKPEKEPKKTDLYEFLF